MTYTKLYPTLLQSGLIKTRFLPTIPNPLPWWYKPEAHCAFHQRAPRHDLETCFSLKAEVQKLVKNGFLKFRDIGPNVQVNPLPEYGGPSVNMVGVCLEEFLISDVNLVKTPLANMHAKLCKVSLFGDDHKNCQLCE